VHQANHISNLSYHKNIPAIFRLKLKTQKTFDINDMTAKTCSEASNKSQITQFKLTLLIFLHLLFKQIMIDLDTQLTKPVDLWYHITHGYNMIVGW